MTWLGNLGLLVSGLKVSGGWILQILELLACGGALLSRDIGSQERSLPSRPALVCLIRRKVEVWQYQGGGVVM